MRVLLVEDDQRLATSLRRSLVDAGMAADTAGDGGEAVAAATKASYDVIVLDWMLPTMDGLEVSRRLRSRSVSTPILMLTARDSVDDRVAGLEAGADDFMVKPFALREVVARIRALARRHVPNRSSEIRVGEVVLDMANCTLKVRGIPVDLTAKEFAIMECFLLNQGRLLTRAQIIERIWASDFEGGRNLIEVYIGRLRRKLTEAGAGDPFTTVRGFGYRYDG